MIHKRRENKSDGAVSAGRNKNSLPKRWYTALSGRMSIRTRLILSFAVPIAFIILLGVASFLKASSGIRNSYENSTAQTISMTSRYLQLGIKSVEDISSQYLSDDSIQKYFSGYYMDNAVKTGENYQAINNSILSKKTTNDFISDITILSDKVPSISTTKMKDGISCAQFYQTERGEAVNKENKTVWVGADDYLDGKLGDDGKIYSLRLIRKLPGTDAVIIIDLDNSIVTDILRGLDIDETGTVGLVTSDGKEILGGDDNSNEAIFADKQFYQTALLNEEINGAGFVDDQGTKELFIYSKLGQTGAMLCATIPKAVIYNQADSIRDITIIIVIIACIVAVLIAAVISTGMHKEISSIAAGLKKVSEGDLTAEFYTKRRDEFGKLNGELQHTFAKMKELIVNVKKLSIEVSDSACNVAKTSEDFYQASHEISHAVNEIEQGINQQAENAGECLSQMEKLSGKISVVDDNAKEISRIADDTRMSISDGTIVTRDLNSQTKATMEISEEIIRGIEELTVKSMSISKIINVISEIAGQSNLLSLNASIEAARAGEHGKGFAVVAEEMGKLANQSGSSVKEIQKIINDIQEVTKDVAATAGKAETVMRQQEKAVENTTSSYLRINENVEKLVLNQNGILENVDNIEQARVSTLRAIENISAILEEIAASSEMVNQTALNQLKTVETLKASADNLNGNSGNLVNAVDTFTI